MDMVTVSLSRSDYEFLMDSLAQTITQSQVLVKNPLMMMRLSAEDRKQAFDRLNRQHVLLDTLREASEGQE